LEIVNRKAVDSVAANQVAGAMEGMRNRRQARQEACPTGGRLDGRQARWEVVATGGRRARRQAGREAGAMGGRRERCRDSDYCLTFSHGNMTVSTLPLSLFRESWLELVDL
jgi:hypothetical protein